MKKRYEVKPSEQPNKHLRSTASSSTAKASDSPPTKSIRKDDRVGVSEASVNAIEDYVATLTPIEMCRVNRLDEIKKLHGMGVFVPVLKSSLPKHCKVFGHTWVDKLTRVA